MSDIGSSEGAGAKGRTGPPDAGGHPWRSARGGLRRQVLQVLAIAGNTARELVRNPAYAVLVGSGAAVTALSPAFALFHLGEQVKMVVDLGLGTTLVAGLLVGVFGASWAVSEELEGRSAVAVLAKPVSRGAFLVGKYLGVLAAAALAVGLQGIALLFTLRAISPDAGVFFVCAGTSAASAMAGGVAFRRLGMTRSRAAILALSLATAALLLVLDERGTLAALGRSLSGWAWVLLLALVGVVLQVAVLASLAVALATRLPLSANLPAILALFVLGQLAGELHSCGAGGRVLGALLPDIGIFQFSEAVARQVSEVAAAAGTPVSACVLSIACGVACAYVTGALGLGAALLGTREVA